MALRVRKNKAVIPSRCPIAKGMGLLSGAWAPNVIWYLSAQPRRFGELRADIPGISARVLSARLRELEAKGVITRSVVATSPPSVEYALADVGHELVAAIVTIVQIGHKVKEPAPFPPPPRSRRPGPPSAVLPTETGS